MNAADDIAEFLATRRAKITPEQAGLPSYGKRRVPGPAPRGGRVAGRRERRLLPAAGARPGQLASPSSCWKRWRGRSGSTTPSARTSSTWPAPRARSRQDARGRPRRASVQSCSACSTRSRRRRSSAPSTATTWRPTRSAVRCTRRCSTAPSSPPTARASPSWTRRRATSIPTGSRLASELVASLRSQAGRNPYDRKPPGPHRRAVDAQRRVPRPLGGAQRALPPDGQQAPAPSDRRRAGAQLRDADARRRRRTAHGALHRRSPSRPPSRRWTCWPVGRQRRSP